MAHIYAGDASKVDVEVLKAVQTLPDDFWIFAEFDIERNVDWLAIREVPATERTTRPSTMILTELKRSDKPIRAWNMNGPWEKLEDTGVYTEVHNDKPEINYYQQALHTSSALQDWLWRNQRFYLDSHLPVQPIDSFKPWPDLLILSPPGVRHQLPIRPPTGYGGFWFGLDQWTNHVQRWNPRAGYSWSKDELTKLAEFLGLTEVASPHVIVATAAAPGAVPKEIADFLGWVVRLEERVAQLERQLAALGSDAGASSGAQPPAPAAPTAPEQPASVYRPSEPAGYGIGYNGTSYTTGSATYAPGQQFEGRVYRISPQRDYVLASLSDGYTVLLHISKMSENFQRRLNMGQVDLGATIRMEVLAVERDRGQVRIEVRDVGTPPPAALPEPSAFLLRPPEDTQSSW